MRVSKKRLQQLMNWGRIARHIATRRGGVRRRRGRTFKDGSLKSRNDLRSGMLTARSATDGEIFSDRLRKNAALYGGLFRDRRPYGDRDVFVARGLSSGSVRAGTILGV